MLRMRGCRVVCMVKEARIVRMEQESVVDQAIDWHVRLTEANESEWADFVVWIEADAAHAEAYDVVASQDRLIGDAEFPARVPVPVAVNDNSPRRWAWMAGGAIAAALTAALLVPGPATRSASPYEIATRPGERQTIALADGTKVEVSGGTRLRLDHADTRVATLVGGEATFHVRHDAAHPFAIATGAITISDMGTVFDVTRDGARVSLAVAEGAVSFRAGGQALTLRAGDALVADERIGQVSRGTVAPDTVGSWRSDTLSFDGQPLSEVAARLNRLYATGLSVDASLSAQPFTGMVRFTGAADRDVPHLAGLIGANWRRDGKGWTLASGGQVSR